MLYFQSTLHYFAVCALLQTQHPHCNNLYSLQFFFGSFISRRNSRNRYKDDKTNTKKQQQQQQLLIIMTKINFHSFWSLPAHYRMKLNREMVGKMMVSPCIPWHNIEMIVVNVNDGFILMMMLIL